MTILQIENEAIIKFNKKISVIYTDLFKETTTPSQIHKFYRSKITELLERTKLEKYDHVIDRELYEDSGGGSMCEVCGRQGAQLDEDCMLNNDFFNYNQAVQDQQTKINEALK